MDDDERLEVANSLKEEGDSNFKSGQLDQAQ